MTHDISMADFMHGFEMLDAKDAIKVIMHPIEEGY